MVAEIATLAFEGVSARRVAVQAQLSSGTPAFAIVGLPDKAVAESRERVRAALQACGLGLPPKRIIVNLAPADLPKEGAHFDLPIALAVLCEMGALPSDACAGRLALGELGLDGRLAPTPGVLPAAIAASAGDQSLLCPAASGAEAAWAGDELEIVAAPDLIALLNHMRGAQTLPRPTAGGVAPPPPVRDLRDVKGQERAKRALEIAAAGGHNLLMCGPPGAGKSMLAARLPGILPPMSAAEALETSTIASLAGLLKDGQIATARPFRAPHHSASMAAMVGGGVRAKPGEVSLAHNGVLFLDELPEFAPQVLDALRQPLETGDVVVARANAHVRYPARTQLIAAMNPCRCGWAGDPNRGCRRDVAACVAKYRARLSGPLLDRIDLTIDTPPVSPADLALPPSTEGSTEIAARVAAARDRQTVRYAHAAADQRPVNADADGPALDASAAPDSKGRALLLDAADRLGLTARGYHRCLRVSRTIADLDGADGVRAVHVAEALSYREGGAAPTSTQPLAA